MKLTEVTSYRSRTATILNEGYQDLTESQVIYLNRWEKELWPLVEQYIQEASQNLTPDQIQDIFKGAESVADASGENKNLLGKAGSAVGAAAKLPVDVAKKVDAKINELGAMAKNAGPVKNADAKFAQLKKDITANNPDSKIVQSIQKVSDWAKENPGKASLAVGILTAVAAFAGGPLGGAAAGLIFRSTNELLKGADLSTAVGKSIKTAAYGAIAGWALEGIGDWLEGLRFDSIPYEKAPGLTTLEVGFKDTLSYPGFESVRDLGSMVVPEDRLSEFEGLLNALKDATAGSGTTSDPAALDAFDDLWNFAKTFDKKAFLDDMNLTNDIYQAVAAENDAFLQNLKVANDVIAAAAQGSMQTTDPTEPLFKVGDEEVTPESGEGDDTEGVAVKSTTDSINFDNDMDVLFDEWLREAPKLSNPGGLGARLKGAVKGAGAGIAKGAKAAGGAIAKGAKEISSNVTAAKLNSQWKKMGEPTDAGSIYNLLTSFGMDDAMVQQIATGAKVELKPSGDAKTVTTAPGKKAGASATGDAADTTTSTIQKGDVQEINGVQYKWEGALWTDTTTGKPVGVIPAIEMGLPNPKIDPIVQAAKKDPAIAKAIKTQISAKGVEAGTADAAKAAKAGVKGTDSLDAGGVGADKKKIVPGSKPAAPAAKAPVAKAAKKTPNPKAPAKKPVAK
jgi:hypothetical protein